MENCSTESWTDVRVRKPCEGVIVDTMIRDCDGKRNEGKLKRQGNLWFVPDGSMYVYYTPTHWREC